MNNPYNSNDGVIFIHRAECLLYVVLETLTSISTKFVDRSYKYYAQSCNVLLFHLKDVSSHFNQNGAQVSKQRHLALAYMERVDGQSVVLTPLTLSAKFFVSVGTWDFLTCGIPLLGLAAQSLTVPNRFLIVSVKCFELGCSECKLEKKDETKRIGHGRD